MSKKSITEEIQHYRKILTESANLKTTFSQVKAQLQGLQAEAEEGDVTGKMGVKIATILFKRWSQNPAELQSLDLQDPDLYESIIEMVLDVGAEMMDAASDKGLYVDEQTIAECITDALAGTA